MNGKKWMVLRTCGAGKVFRSFALWTAVHCLNASLYVLVKLPVTHVIAIQLWSFVFFSSLMTDSAGGGGYLMLNFMIYKPYPRVNCLKTIPFTAAHSYIAHIWQYPPPRGNGHLELVSTPLNWLFIRWTSLIRPKHSAGILKGVSHKGSWPHNFIIRDVKHDFTSNGNREFVPRDQVSSLLVVYCSSLLLLN